jgi:hypothetical protein
LGIRFPLAGGLPNRGVEVLRGNAHRLDFAFLLRFFAGTKNPGSRHDR